MKKGTLRSQAGFSLVELMVVVAIIGVLAAMSAGQVQKQIAKARQSEAKSNLATLWSSLETFKSEYNAYTTDFVANKIAFSGNLRYHVGFAANHVASAGLGGYSGTSRTTAFNTAQADGCGVGTACVALAGATAPAGTAMNNAAAIGARYTARASGQPMQNVADVWDITDNKLLTNSTDGIQ